MKKVTFCDPVKKDCVSKVLLGDLGPSPHKLQSTGFKAPNKPPLAITIPTLAITEKDLGLRADNLLQPPLMSGHNNPFPDLTKPQNLVPTKNPDSNHKIASKPPKKPVSNFMMFVNEHRASFIQKGLSDKEASDRAVNLWNTSSPAVKNKYQIRYEKQKSEYDNKMAKYKENMINKKDQKKGAKGNI